MAEDATPMTLGSAANRRMQDAVNDHPRCHGSERQGRRLRADRPSGTFNRTAPAAWSTVERVAS